MHASEYWGFVREINSNAIVAMAFLKIEYKACNLRLTLTELNTSSIAISNLPEHQKQVQHYAHLLSWN